jgi:hypothetical protein
LDCAQVQLGQRRVVEAQPFQPGRPCGGDIFLQIDLDMIRFPP